MSEVEELEKLIEAALFMAPRPLTIFELLKITNSDLQSVKSAIKNLQNQYEQRGSWIEIVRLDKTYLMRLKPQYSDKISQFAQETELSKRALRVLAIVANHDGILQSKIVKTLGPSTYEGVAELEEKKYLVTEKKGHSKILRLSQKFKTYFGEIPVGEMRRGTREITEESPAQIKQQEKEQEKQTEQSQQPKQPEQPEQPQQ